MYRLFHFRTVLLLGMVCGCLDVVAHAQDEESKSELPQKVYSGGKGSVPNLMALEGHTIDVRFEDGAMIGRQEVVSVSEGKTPGSLRSLKVRPKDSTRTRTIGAAKVDELFLDDLPLDVVYDKKQRGLVHSPEKRTERLRHRREVNERLSRTSDRLWEPLSDEQQKQFLESQQDFLQRVQKSMSQLPFRNVETEFFSVLTDLPPEQVDGYLLLLDEMYRKLCGAFGLPAEKNIWCGKCVVILFARRVDYYAFETGLMRNPNPVGTQGLCHMSSDGQVIFAGYRGDAPDYFGVVLIHETTHGFVHRYLSSVRIPSWLDEGMSDWIAHAIMKDKHIPLKRIESARFVRATGGWGDFLTTDHIRGELYGAASTMVAMLVERDKSGQFREFFRGIKEGKPVDESLKDTFDMSFRSLEIFYAEYVSRVK